MQSLCKMVDYNISKFSYEINIKNKNKKKRAVTFETQVEISVSAKEKNKGIVYIRTNAHDEDDEIKYYVAIRGLFDLMEELSDNQVKEKALKEEGFVELYRKLEEVLNQIQVLTKQKLPALPQIDSINEGTA